jgi:thioredoxin-like negative regulator of GroEL
LYICWGGVSVEMKNDELASYGIQAFQAGEYTTAAEFLSELVRLQPTLWTCRLYLAMAYQCQGQQSKATEELTTISQWATDQSVKKKAVEALRALHARASQSAGTAMAGVRKGTSKIHSHTA